MKVSHGGWPEGNQVDRRLVGTFELSDQNVTRIPDSTLRWQK